MTCRDSRQLLRDARGAVFVEKLIVYLPLLMTFFGAWELAELGAAKIVVQRACAAAGRAAMVVLPDDPVFYDDEPVGSFDGQRRADIELAAGMILSAVPRLRDDFEVDVSDAPGDTTGTIDVTLTAPYDCGLVSLVCGDDDSVDLTAESTHQYHGAKYAYSSAALGGSTGALVDGSGGGDFRAAAFRARGGQNNNNKPPPPAKTSTGCAELEKQKTTTFYRTMSQAHADELLRTGKLNGTKETCISPTAAFSMNYDGVLIKFTVKTNTVADLAAGGFKHTSAWIKMKCPCLPPMRKGWISDGAAFKTEGPQLNICLGNGKGLETFNNNIVSYEVVDKTDATTLAQAAQERADLEQERIKQEAELATWKKKMRTLRDECKKQGNAASCKELSKLTCEDEQPCGP